MIAKRLRKAAGPWHRMLMFSLLNALWLASACQKSSFSGTAPTVKPASNKAAAGNNTGVGNAQGNGVNTGNVADGSGINPGTNAGTPPKSNGFFPDLISSILANLPQGGNNSPNTNVPAYVAPDVNANIPIAGNLTACSNKYWVPATANPYMAGEPGGTTITYDLSHGGGPDPVDKLPNTAPVLVAPIGDNCIVPGNTLYFWVTGLITFSNEIPPTNADGFVNSIYPHQKGNLFGKSDITAPLSSLLGVFLGDGDPTNNGAPGSFDFSSQAARDYTLLQPQVGQIFFIGTGKTSSGEYRKVVVPQGATRLYFGVMDWYQWNNNSGGVSGQIFVEK